MENRRLRVVNVPIESIEWRYSAMWNRVIPKRFGSDIRVEEFINIYPDEYKEDKLKCGAFLDPLKTNLFKSKQLQTILELIDRKGWGYRRGDVLFVHDLWFPGLEALFYVRDALKLTFKVFGILHAGVYDPEDYLSWKGCFTWGRWLERTLFEGIDGIFVATNFHRNMILQSLKGCEDLVETVKRKITVLGALPYVVEGDWCWSVEEDWKSRKKLSPIVLVVFPHRCDKEKGYWYVRELEKIFAGTYQIVTTSTIVKDKEQYFKFLKRATMSISFAKQETWGIAMWESVLAGCIPFVPDSLSYVELYPELFRYKSMFDLIRKMREVGELIRSDEFVGSSYFNELLDLRNMFIVRGESVVEVMIDVVWNTIFK